MKASANLEQFFDPQDSPDSLEDILSRIASRWEASQFEHACAILRSGVSGRWKEYGFVTGSSCRVSSNIREIMRRVVTDNIEAVILCHYHPVGDSQPSQTDLHTTRSIAQICRALRVELRDHIIFAPGEPFSFRRHGYL